MGEGQQHSRVHPWTSAVVTALAGGGGAVLALLGLRWGQATDAVASAVRLQPWAKVGEGQQRSRVHPWTSAAMMAPAGGGGAALGGQWLLLVAVLASQLGNL